MLKRKIQKQKRIGELLMITGLKKVQKINA